MATQVGTHHLGMACVPSLPLPLPSLFCGQFSPGQPEIQVHWNCRQMQKRWAVPPRNAMASRLRSVATILQVEP